MIFFDMKSILSETVESIKWVQVLICMLTLTTLHLAFHSESVQQHLPASLISTNGGEEYLALVLTVKDEGYYLKEWLQHHYYHMNVSHFYIIDVGCKCASLLFGDFILVELSNIK